MTTVVRQGAMNLHACPWAACSVLVLLACGENGAVQPTRQPQPVVIALVSGDDQPAKAGVELAQPFVVRVTDHRGVGLRNYQVRWTVTSGEGVLQDSWIVCPSGRGVGDPVPTIFARTDTAGFAQLSFMPTWFGPVTVMADAIGAPDPVVFSTDATDTAATLTIESGNGQPGLVLDWLQEPLVVRVTDGQGDPVPHVAVLWKSINAGPLVSDYGCSGADDPLTAVLRTGEDGLTVEHGGRGLRFRPQTIGSSQVLAVLPGPHLAPDASRFNLQAVLFDIDVNGILIDLGLDFFGTPRLFPHVAAVPLGGTMEWLNRFPTARITSTTVPPGGVPFDSGMLTQNARFSFVPGVTGTWEYIDLVSQLRGTFTAQ